MLQGNTQLVKPSIKLMSADEFVRACQQQENGFMYLLYSKPMVGDDIAGSFQDQSQELTSSQHQLKTLLDSYTDIFQPPEGLPPMSIL